MKFNAFFISLCLLASGHSAAAEKTIIHIGVQASGTVDWELAALQENPQADFKLDIQHVANAEAGKIALQSGAVDMIVSDWIWVSRLRAAGSDFTFYPYSTTSGALMVAKDSPIHNVKDLNGKRLGIAGGELDKNWLLLQALAGQQQLDLNASVEKVFGAPPLINEQLKQNRVDAALNYWHFAARLEAEGYRQIIDGKAILKGLGIEETVPNLGYVFKQSWANEHKQALKGFFSAGKQAKNQLCTDDAAWKKIIPLTKVDDAATQAKLRQRYCEGGIEHWGEAQQQAAGRIYMLLRKLSNNQLTGQAENLQSGTFWTVE
ncbi:MAG: ABC transporter substrate-binding protein [Methylobacter sp.]|nr:ABC transporter substrate-binding protein [Methylobacter sp.]MDP2099361.1 ABC transporter substrate-binding protein [Methylobacter sp.]MDP2427297.1 ABC transporter substrate-binding protein [Methylobacter sp.]MDP3054876.1 ABC transporter substrate-binding protein [Methylobacter sp.]MDZ4218092.1 ABC transporter substrate-binding protein [Methylobacter sp.]